MARKKEETENKKCLSKEQIDALEINALKVKLHETLVINEQLRWKLIKAELEKQELKMAEMSKIKNDVIATSKDYIESLKREFQIEGSFGYDPITGEVA